VLGKMSALDVHPKSIELRYVEGPNAFSQRKVPYPKIII
jgi:hypothetical protein